MTQNTVVYPSSPKTIQNSYIKKNANYRRKKIHAMQKINKSSLRFSIIYNSALLALVPFHPRRIYIQLAFVRAYFILHTFSISISVPFSSLIACSFALILPHHIVSLEILEQCAGICRCCLLTNGFSEWKWKSRSTNTTDEHT